MKRKRKNHNPSQLTPSRRTPKRMILIMKARRTQANKMRMRKKKDREKKTNLHRMKAATSKSSKRYRPRIQMCLIKSRVNKK
jgi:hypothetical protein